MSVSSIGIPKSSTTNFFEPAVILSTAKTRIGGGLKRSWARIEAPSAAFICKEFPMLSFSFSVSKEVKSDWLLIGDKGVGVKNG